MVDVRDTIDEADDLRLERLGLTRARVGEDALAYLGGQVEGLGDSERLLVMAEAEAEALVQLLVERRLARVTEGRMAHVVSETDRLGQILVQP